MRAWAGRFDADWYAARNSNLEEYSDDPLVLFIHLGLVAGLAPNALEENRKCWDGVFDCDWYMERNPDVKNAQLDPLEHFIEVGIRDRRKPNREWNLDSRPVDNAALKKVKHGAVGKKVVLFITHSSQGNIRPHVQRHLESFHNQGISTILIIARDSKLQALPLDLIKTSDVIYYRDNEGFDFAAWAHIIKMDSNLLKSDTIYFCNDSVVGPISLEQFSNIISRVRKSSADIIGLTESLERGWHAQSYFLAFKHRALSSERFQAFVSEAKSHLHKEDVINEY